MNPQIERLYHISQKKERRIIGLMSGTSLDGLDIAVCRIENAGKTTKIQLEHFTTMDYEDDLRARVREVFAKRNIDQQLFSGLHAYIGITHAKLINRALQQWNISSSEIDCIASHGQTVYHAPQSLTRDLNWPNSTLQIGDGDHIAVDTGIITLSDFRQKHIAAGGEGAPLAAYGDFLLFSHPTENRFLLNIGGISNFTFIPSHQTKLNAYATDLGPGNTMMNQYMKANFDQEMDRDAYMAKKGKVNDALLNQLLTEEFLTLSFPKTTGPELFNLAYLEKAQDRSKTTHIPHEDVMATLNRFAADAIINGIRKQSEGLSHVAVYISGGGLHNPLLFDYIKRSLPMCNVESFARLGINPDAKEAVLFALLANETLAGNKSNVEQIKDSPAVCMGKISLPE
ncbi:anhydro-N-acetylmuramic acid kinase [Sphingobacterium sp. UBA5670]|uniref:anhydro-N-acetylmuramic acid kinase n=1 Tax=Sphingobacterium sp. UBA5670 TaxID=1947502 RepID=UPI0025E79E4F|nr:anhydro-N-acetylmuramic acid kinase [Sphingobacterium sp. UBA5670]